MHLSNPPCPYFTPTDPMFLTTRGYTSNPFPSPLHGYAWLCMATSYPFRAHTCFMPTFSHPYPYPLYSLLSLHSTTHATNPHPRIHYLTPLIPTTHLCLHFLSLDYSWRNSHTVINKDGVHDLLNSSWFPI